MSVNQKRPFVHNSDCSPFLEGLFAILAECSQFCFEALLRVILEEIPHFAGWEGGGLRGAKIVNRNFVNKLAFPSKILVRNSGAGNGCANFMGA